MSGASIGSELESRRTEATEIRHLERVIFVERGAHGRLDSGGGHNFMLRAPIHRVKSGSVRLQRVIGV